jgi:uncharacterized heparinase superfamily protein
MTDRLDRAIRAACFFLYQESPKEIFESQRAYAQALIADILKQDSTTPSFETLTMDPYSAAIYAIRRRAGLLTPEEMALEEEWEQS